VNQRLECRAGPGCRRPEAAIDRDLAHDGRQVVSRRGGLGLPTGRRAEASVRQAARYQMRALTVRQPWAWAIIHAGKDIENRSWTNRHATGTIAVHAGSGLDPLDRLPRGAKRPGVDDLVRGAIIGVVDVVEVVETHRPNGEKSRAIKASAFCGSSARVADSMIVARRPRRTQHHPGMIGSSRCESNAPPV
jgi:hypothetical protein